MLQRSHARFVAVLVAATLATACGGGGGGEGGGGGGASGLRVNPTSLAFRAISGDPDFVTTGLTISWTSPSVAGVLAGVPAGQSLPGWLELTSLVGSASPLSLWIRRTAGLPPPGQYSQTLRVVTGDANGRLLDLVDIPVSLVVAPAPTVSPTSIPLAWVESEQPAATQLSVSRDPRIVLVSATVDAAWLSVSRNGDTITLTPAASAPALAAGVHTATVTVSFALDGSHKVIHVPVTATVTPALTAAAPISFEVNASTTDAALAALRGTVATGTQAGLTLDPEVDVTWLTASGPVVTGGADNLALTIPKAALETLPNGVLHGSVTLRPRVPNVAALVVPVTLTVRLPEVHFVAPVAFTDTLETDYVIVRGLGLDDPAAVPYVDSTPVSSTTHVNDRELRIVPGARTAGDHVVEVPNELGLARSTAKLRVTTPPSYSSTSVDATIGMQSKVVPSPINGVVFTALCYFCGSGTGTPSTVQRFAYDSVAGTWSRAQYSYPELYDIAMSPDESELLVVTRTTLRRVDPSTMATTDTITLPYALSAGASQLGVLNDGRVIIQNAHRTYSLRDHAFAYLPEIDLGFGIATSRDGSRAFVGSSNYYDSVPYQYYDASTSQLVASSSFLHYSWAQSSRHAERSLASTSLVDHELALIASFTNFGVGTADLSPDGQRVYVMDIAASKLRRIDVSNPQQISDLAPIDVAASGRVATDPRGSYVYVVGESKFLVVDVR